MEFDFNPEEIKKNILYVESVKMKNYNTEKIENNCELILDQKQICICFSYKIVLKKKKKEFISFEIFKKSSYFFNKEGAKIVFYYFEEEHKYKIIFDLKKTGFQIFSKFIKCLINISFEVKYLKTLEKNENQKIEEIIKNLKIEEIHSLLQKLKIEKMEVPKEYLKKIKNSQKKIKTKENQNISILKKLDTKIIFTNPGILLKKNNKNLKPDFLLKKAHFFIKKENSIIKLIITSNDLNIFLIKIIKENFYYFINKKMKTIFWKNDQERQFAFIFTNLEDKVILNFQNLMGYIIKVQKGENYENNYFKIRNNNNFQDKKIEIINNKNLKKKNNFEIGNINFENNVNNDLKYFQTDLIDEKNNFENNENNNLEFRNDFKNEENNSRNINKNLGFENFDKNLDESSFIKDRSEFLRENPVGSFFNEKKRNL